MSLCVRYSHEEADCNINGLLSDQVGDASNKQESLFKTLKQAMHDEHVWEEQESYV